MTVDVELGQLSTEIQAHPGEEAILPFDAVVAGSDVVVTALMERTAAYHPRDDRYDSHVIRLDLVFVFPDAIQWKAKASSDGRPGAHYRNYKTTAAPAAEQRELSDQRALADQATKRQAADREESLRRASVATAAEGKETPMAIGQRISQERREELKAQGLQHCSHCDKDKPTSEFRSNGYCKPCGVAYDKARLAKKPGVGHPTKAKPAKKAIVPSAIGQIKVPSAIPAESKELTLKPLNGEVAAFRVRELSPLTQSVLAALDELEQLREFKRRILEVASA